MAQKCFMCGAAIARGILCEKCDKPRKPKQSAAKKEDRSCSSASASTALAQNRSAKAPATRRSGGAATAAAPAPEPEPFPKAPLLPFPVESASPAITSVANVIMAAGAPAIVLGADRSGEVRHRGSEETVRRSAVRPRHGQADRDAERRAHRRAVRADVDGAAHPQPQHPLHARPDLRRRDGRGADVPRSRSDESGARVVRVVRARDDLHAAAFVARVGAGGVAHAAARSAARRLGGNDRSDSVVAGDGAGSRRGAAGRADAAAWSTSFTPSPIVSVRSPI